MTIAFKRTRLPRSEMPNTGCFRLPRLRLRGPRTPHGRSGPKLAFNNVDQRGNSDGSDERGSLLETGLWPSGLAGCGGTQPTTTYKNSQPITFMIQNSSTRETPPIMGLRSPPGRGTGLGQDRRRLAGAWTL